MSLDESLSHVSSSFGLPLSGRGPRALVTRLVAKLVWPLVRHQVDMNQVLIAELRDLRARHDELVDLRARHDELVAVVAATRDVTDQQALALDAERRRTGVLEDWLGRIEEWLRRIEDARANIENALHILEEQYTSVATQRESHLADVQSHLAKRTQQLENQIDLGQRQLLARFYDGFGALQRDVAQLTSDSADLSAQLASDRGELVAQVEGVRAAYAHFEETKIATLLARMAEVDHFLLEVKRSYPELVAPARLVTLASGFDAIERAHAMRFRGSRAEIIERISVYLPELTSVAHLGAVLDIGCGGGELLELLREHDISAYGIEIVESAVEECRAQGLDARLDDVVHHLSSVPAGSLGAVTAIHVVEHLGIETLLETIDLALRALAPGGLLIFETPNPGNVLVGADSFYIDPTHDHPIPSTLLEFLVSIRGFAGATVVPLKRAPDHFSPVMPVEGDWAIDVTRLAQHVSSLFLGAEDYAVIARRAL
jgi:O-antigen chain-terminating methyltransferase